MLHLDRYLSRATQRRIKDLKNSFKAIPFRGEGRVCPVCAKSSSHFRAYALVRREDAQCAHCEALERHRFVWLFMEKKTDLFDGRKKRVLHVAPEQSLEPRFKARLKDSYITADLDASRADVQMDITDIQYPDESFDVIYCSHVLEHVPNDRAAMAEFYRTLAGDGWAILLVPMRGETTREDPTIMNPEQRLKAYGHPEHVRYYGMDYVDRLRAVGFKVSVFSVRDVASDEEAVQMGLTGASGKIFYCTK